MRRTFVHWHRWFGLIAAAWLFLLGATGSILVFYEEIDHLINPDLFLVSDGAPRPVSQWINAAKAQHPDSEVRFINLPDQPGEVAEISMARSALLPEREDAPSWEVMIDPATARVLGSRDRNAIDLSRRGIMNFLYTFHYSLHLGEWIEWLIGLVALAWIIDHVASAALSFPSAAKWRESFRIRRGVKGHKRVFDLHRAGGLWLFPITLTLAVTGIYFNWNEEFRAVVGAVSPLTPRPDEQAKPLVKPLAQPPVSFDQALANAGAARVDGVAYNPEKGLYWLRLFDAKDIDRYGRRWMFVDARNGTIMSDRHITDGSAGDVLIAWQFPLHSGKAFGWPGRIAIFLGGIALCMFVVTGLMIWMRKRSARILSEKRPARRAPPEIAPAE